MYQTLLQRYCWSHMAKDDYVTVAHCTSYVQNGSRYKHKRLLQLFPTKGTLWLVTWDFLVLLQKPLQVNQYVLGISIRYPNLTRDVPTSITTESNVANLFFDHWIISSGNRTYLVMDTGPRFKSEFFRSVSRQLEIKHFTTTPYHPQTNEWAEQFSKTPVTRLNNGIAEHQRSWDIFGQSFTYACNTQTRRRKKRHLTNSFWFFAHSVLLV